MKDREARSDIAWQQLRNKAVNQEIADLRLQVTNLQEAFDALFDVVATDLGYQAKAADMSPGFYVPTSIRRRASPRQFEMTTPTEPQLVRTITAIGKKITK